MLQNDLAKREEDLYEKALSAVERILDDAKCDPSALGQALKFIKDHDLAESRRKQRLSKDVKRSTGEKKLPFAQSKVKKIEELKTASS